MMFTACCSTSFSLSFLLLLAQCMASGRVYPACIRSQSKHKQQHTLNPRLPFPGLYIYNNHTFKHEMHGWQAGSFHYTVCPPTIVILTNFMFWCMKYK